MGFNPPKPAVDTTLNPKFFDALTPAPTWTVNSGQGAHSCKRQGWDGGGMPHQQEFANNSDPRHPHHSRPLEWRAVRQTGAQLVAAARDQPWSPRDAGRSPRLGKPLVDQFYGGANRQLGEPPIVPPRGMF